MSGKNSPWGGSGGSSGGSGGGGKGPWGGNGGRRGPSRGNRPGAGQADLDNVIKGFKDKFGSGGPVKRGGSGKPSGLGVSTIVLGVVAVLLLMSSIFTVQAEEEAVILRFGEYKRTVDSGLHFKLPSPIETKIVKQVTIQQETEVGINRGRDVPSESLMLTGDENIVDVDFTVLWRINNLEDFLFKVDAPEKLVKAVSESVMREVIGKNELDVIITTEREKLRGLVQEQVQKILDEYEAGVEINDIQFQKTDPPANVMDAFLNVVNASQEAESMVNEAHAYQNKHVLEAEGAAAKMIQAAEAYRDKIIAEANGEAERFRLVYEEYKRSPNVIRQRMYLDVMKDVYDDVDKIVIDGKAGSGVVPYLPLNELNKRGGK